FDVFGSHAFAADARAVTVTIRDNGGASTTITTPVAVADAAIDLASRSGATVEGVPFNGAVAHLFDHDPRTLTSRHYSATIDWGDGTTTVGTIVPGDQGGFDVVGTHTYPRFRKTPYPIGVAVQDGDGTQATTTASLRVDDAPLEGTGA